MAENLKNKKEKKKCLSIEQRCNILRRIEEGASVTQLAAEFNVTSQAISMVKKREKSILRCHNILRKCEGNMNKKRYTAVEEDPLEQKLYEWLKQSQAMGLPISGGTLRKQALLFNERLGNRTNFKASDGWITKFKKRHGLIHINVEGETSWTDHEGSEDFKIKLDNIIKVTGTSLDHIYTCDVTELYWKIMPNKTFVIKTEKCTNGRRKSKNRVTIMTCTNASGTHKIPLFVIGKYAQPRCFKGIKNFPVFYTHQKNALMTNQLIDIWYTKHFLSEVSKKYNIDNNNDIKIILIMGNNSCPPSEILNSIFPYCTIFYLPPNATPLIQPLDQGIIEQFKKNYRYLFITKLLTESKAYSNDDFINSVNILECLNFCKEAWDVIKPTSIRNCWNKLIPLEKGHSDVESIDVAALHSLVVQVPECNMLSVNDINNWIQIDCSISRCQPISNDNIMSGKYSYENKSGVINELNDEVQYEDQDSCSTDAVVESNNMPTFEALNALKSLISYYQKKENSSLNVEYLQKWKYQLMSELVNKK